MKLITLLALILTLNACSMPDSKKEEVAVQNDDLEFAVDTLADTPVVESSEINVEEQKIAEIVVPDEHQAPPVQESEVAMVVPPEPMFEEFKTPEEKVEEIVAEVPVEAPAKINIVEPGSDATPSYGPMETYQMQKGDTLMMVAFKIYGDYRKWKDLKNWNKEHKKITEGVELKYIAPAEKFSWMPSGLPHLVKTGDTLQLISVDKYGTSKKWKAIYENNRPLIKDPNLIFAGFTIYYQPMRDLASEPK